MGIDVKDVWVSDDAGDGVVGGNGTVCGSAREASLTQSWLDKEEENKR